MDDAVIDASGQGKLEGIGDEYKHALVRSELRSALGGSSYYAIIVEEYPELNRALRAWDELLRIEEAMSETGEVISSRLKVAAMLAIVPMELRTGILKKP